MAMAKLTQKFIANVAGRCGAMVCTAVDGQRTQFDPTLIITLISTLLPMLQGWFQKCRERRQQQDTPQQHVASDYRDPVKRQKNVKALAGKILQECAVARRLEIKRARQTGVPADIGRFAMDEAGALRLADKMHGEIANMSERECAALCAECGVT